MWWLTILNLQPDCQGWKLMSEEHMSLNKSLCLSVPLVACIVKQCVPNIIVRELMHAKYLPGL